MTAGAHGLPPVDPAYRLDGAPVEPEAFYRVACDPRRSVVVEACAGAGKTWMLVARILRALLDGAEPQQILAITFTRKAAGEMRGRLAELMQAAAQGSAQDRVTALRQRGMDEASARAAAPRLAVLAEQLLGAGRRVEIRTFHGWFGQLLRAAPHEMLERLGLAAEFGLLEDTEEIEPHLWRRFLSAVEAEPQLRADHARLVQQRGRSTTRDWLLAALRQRVEIERADAAGALEDSVPDAATWNARFAGLAHPVEAASTGPLRQQLLALAAGLGRGAVKAQDAARGIEQALAPDAQLTAQQRFEALWIALHTKLDEPRKLGKVVAPEALADILEELALVRDAIAQQDAHEEHLRLVRLSRVLLASYGALKRDDGLADMADLETCAEALLADSELSGWLQERLDARIGHLLIDEFQDTNPTQWRALHAWLDGYAGAGGGASGQAPLSVFLVGDPKQSIYRFRRADPRVFIEASRFVQQALGGRHLSCDHTRRNAPPVLGALNAVFGELAAQGRFEGFRAHTTESQDSGALWRLPAVMRPDKKAKPGRTGQAADAADTPNSDNASIAGPAAAPAAWRDSLLTPRQEAEEVLRMTEAQRVADAIARCLAGADGLPPCGPKEVFVLARKRASLLLVEEALRERGIPASAPSDQALADLPEARDLIALLDVLVSPAHDLSLAQALRSPMFDAEDEDLQALALEVAALRRQGREGDAAEPAPTGVAESAAADARRGDGPKPMPAREPARGPSWWSVLMAGAGAGRPALERARSLLPGWAEAARRLPPHDLIDRIFAEGDGLARTLAAVPASRRTLARVTLDALLWQSLQLDGGRHATPYGFVRALKRRPLTLPASAAPGTVQLMTIHGAKGLEAENVFLVDGLPEPPRPATASLLVDWPADADAPRRCAFLASEARCPPSLRVLLEEERAGRQREELNGLYVAITRAKRRLVVSATQPHGSPPQPGPWQRLADAGVPEWPASVEEGGATAGGAADADAGDPRPAQQVGGGVAPGGDLGGPAAEPPLLLNVLPRFSPRGEGGAWTPHVDASASDDENAAARLGRAVHRVLEWLPAPERLGEACEFAAQAFDVEVGGAEEVRRIVGRILESPDCRPFFDPLQFDWSANELPIAWQGEQLRLDRLVRRRGADGRRQWWVLDHKLQHDPLTVPANLAQLSRYREAVRALNPGDDVQAAFITGAGKLRVLDP